MANEQNLKKIRTAEEAREKGRNGGIKSGEARRRKKTMREWLEEIITRPCKTSDGANMTHEECMLVSLVQKAESGDTKAIEIIRDTLGEKPIDRMETSTTTITKYVTKEEQKATNKHIDDVINGTR